MSSSITGLVAAVALLLGGGTAGEQPRPTADKYPGAQYAKTTAQDGVLRKGCRTYTYGYAVKPPAEIWGLETFLVDPRGETIASGGFLSGSDETKGTGTFRFCRSITRPGTFTIKGKFTYRETSQSNPVEGKIKPTKFRLVKKS